MRPTIFVAVGLGLGFSAVTFGEGYAFSQPSDPACEWCRIVAISDRRRLRSWTRRAHTRVHLDVTVHWDPLWSSNRNCCF